MTTEDRYLGHVAHGFHHRHFMGKVEAVELESFENTEDRYLGHVAHGFHHRHFMGKVEAVELESFENIEERFESDWMSFRRKGKK